MSRLEVLSPPALRATRLLREPTLLIGRSPEAGFHIDDRTVSRRHALVRHADGVDRIEDLQSTGGTRVNGQPATSPVLLRDGDTIELAGVKLRYSVGGQTRNLPVPTPTGNTAALYRLAAGLTTIAATLLVARAVVGLVNADWDRRGGPPGEDLAPPVSDLIWAVMLLTITYYVWRAAGRAGRRDRVGRVLIVAGYLLLGLALTCAVSTALQDAGSGPGSQQLKFALLWVLGLGAPAAFLVWYGARLTGERIVTTAYFDVHMRN